MTKKQIYLLAPLIFLLGCFGNSDHYSNHKNNTSSGLSIENGPRQGFQYIDSNSTEYNYRYYTITLTNDTTVPIQLSFGFTSLVTRLNDTSLTKIFLLPRHLTPKQQQYDTHGISPALQYYLDHELEKLIQLDKTIQPKEKCVLTFGVLTNIKYSDPTTSYGTNLLARNGKFELKITNALILPCGQYSFIN